jgi:hypothetical protein
VDQDAARAPGVGRPVGELHGTMMHA